MNGESLVVVDRGEDIATVRLDRPEKLNAVNMTLLRELYDSLKNLHNDPEGGIVISGNGKATCAGIDLNIVSDPNFEGEYKDDIDTLNKNIHSLLRTYPYPTVMAAHGATIGIGFILSLYCDFVVLGDDTHFSLPEIKHDVVAHKALQPLKRMVGIRIAKEIAHTGEPIAPERAYELGLVNKLVPENKVEEEAHDLLNQTLKYNPKAVKELKTELSCDR